MNLNIQTTNKPKYDNYRLLEFGLCWEEILLISDHGSKGGIMRQDEIGLVFIVILNFGVFQCMYIITSIGHSAVGWKARG